MDRPGGVLAVVGGLLAGLAYLVVPVAKVPLVGQVTAPALEEAAPSYPSLAMLPFVPVAALVMLAIGGFLLLARLGRREHRVAGALVLACSGFIALAYLIPFNALQSEIQQVGASGLGLSAATFAGGGFWFALVGALVAATGAALELSEPRRSLRAGA
ncbi:hypothetical protein GCM10023321_26520 [Pseudonocardia eucalypti]|uniref:DUF1772 domain-containing protein n=2 Tax=Pseudonocardia eucalypti TaxID=648755 RepID=A0ABP9PZ45_9PSEU